MTRQQQSGTNRESGYILLAVIFMVALVLIALAVAAPRIAASIQRDKEAELIHRGLQYRQAIKLYYKKFGRYPSSIDQLVNSNNIRFLRQRYADPLVGKDDWKLVRVGQQHVKAMGLFGQPIANAGTPAGALAGGLQGSSGGAFGNSGALPSGTNSTTSSSSSSSSSDSSSSDSSSSSTPSSSSGGLGGSSFGSNNNTNQTFGGAPIMGVASKIEKASIKEYKQQKHYNEWEFIYDPLEDMQRALNLFGGSTNLNGTNGTNGTSSSPNQGAPTGTSNPTPPTSPTSPQQ